MLPFLLLPLAYLLVRRQRPGETPARVIISAGVWWAASLCLLTEALSAVDLLRPVPLFAATVLLVAGAAWIVRSELLSVFSAGLPARIVLFFRRDEYPFPRIVVLVLALLNLPLVFIYTNNLDSVVYHLPRIYNWLQNGNLDPYVASDVRQIYVSSLAGQLVTPSVAVTGSALFVNLLQFLAYLGCCVALYRIGCLLFRNSAAGRWAAVFFATVPAVILEATTPQTDIIAAVFLLFGVECLLTFMRGGIETVQRGVIGNPVVELVLAGALAAAAKITTAPALAGLAVIATGVLLRRRSGAAFAAAGAGLAVALGIIVPPFYRLWTLFPDLRSPHAERLFIAGFEPLAGLVNFLRYSAQSTMGFVAPSAVMRPGVTELVDRWSLALGATVEQLNDWTWSGTGYAPRNWLFHDSLSYDPKVYVAVALMVLASPLIVRRKAHDAAFLGIFLVAAAGWVLFFVTFKWQLWGGRLQVPHIALLSAVVGGALAMRNRPMRAVAATTLLFGIALGLLTSVYNQKKPVFSPRGAWWNWSYVERFIAERSVTEEYERVIELIPALEARHVGVIMIGGEEFLIWKTLVEAHGLHDLPRVHHLRPGFGVPANVRQGQVTPDQLDTLDYIIVRTRPPTSALDLIPDGWESHPATSSNRYVLVCVRPTQ